MRACVCLRARSHSWTFANSFTTTTFTNILYNLWILILLASLRVDKFNLSPFVLAAILLLILYFCVRFRCLLCIFHVLHCFHVAPLPLCHNYFSVHFFYIITFTISNSKEIILLDDRIGRFELPLPFFFSLSLYIF